MAKSLPLWYADQDVPTTALSTLKNTPDKARVGHPRQAHVLFLGFDTFGELQLKLDRFADLLKPLVVIATKPQNLQGFFWPDVTGYRLRAFEEWRRGTNPTATTKPPLSGPWQHTSVYEPIPVTFDWAYDRTMPVWTPTNNWDPATWINVRDIARLPRWIVENLRVKPDPRNKRMIQRYGRPVWDEDDEGRPVFSHFEAPSGFEILRVCEEHESWYVRISGWPLRYVPRSYLRWFSFDRTVAKRTTYIPYEPVWMPEGHWSIYEKLLHKEYNEKIEAFLATLGSKAFDNSVERLIAEWQFQNPPPRSVVLRRDEARGLVYVACPGNPLRLVEGRPVPWAYEWEERMAQRAENPLLDAAIEVIRRDEHAWKTDVTHTTMRDGDPEPPKTIYVDTSCRPDKDLEYRDFFGTGYWTGKNIELPIVGWVEEFYSAGTSSRRRGTRAPSIRATRLYDDPDPPPDNQVYAEERGTRRVDGRGQWYDAKAHLIDPKLLKPKPEPRRPFWRLDAAWKHALAMAQSCEWIAQRWDDKREQLDWHRVPWTHVCPNEQWLLRAQFCEDADTVRLAEQEIVDDRIYSQVKGPIAEAVGMLREAIEKATRSLNRFSAWTKHPQPQAQPSSRIPAHMMEEISTA